MEGRQWEKAIELLSEILREDPLDGEAYQQRSIGNWRWVKRAKVSSTPKRPSSICRTIRNPISSAVKPYSSHDNTAVQRPILRNI